MSDEQKELDIIDGLIKTMKYELPIAVADSASGLAEKMNTTRIAINARAQNYRRHKPGSDCRSGRKTDYWVVTVESDE